MVDEGQGLADETELAGLAVGPAVLGQSGWSVASADGLALAAAGHLTAGRPAVDNVL